MIIQADILIGRVKDDEGTDHQVGVPALVRVDGYGLRSPVWVSDHAWPLGPLGFVMALDDLREVQAAFREYWPEDLHAVDWSILVRDDVA